MTGDEQPAEDVALQIGRLTADNMILKTVLRSLLAALAKSESDGGAGLVADLTVGIEHFTGPAGMPNTGESGRALVRNHALKFVGGLLGETARN